VSFLFKIMGIKENPVPAISDLFEGCQHIIDLRLNKNNQLYALSNHDGVGVIRKIADSLDPSDFSRPYNVRGTVGYGGGGFDLREEIIAFCEKGGAIFMRDMQNSRDFIQVCPGFARTSSPKISPDGRSILFVFEQNGINGLAIAAAHQYGWPRQLALGADFYMQPAWHPHGELIAWVEWDHPYMPWDASRIKLGRLAGMHSRLVEESFIDGKISRSANQPLFSPDGHYLSYIKRDGKWDDLILYDLRSKQKTTLVKADGFHLRMPDWIQGLHSYQWTPDSQSIFFIKYHQGTASLESLNIHSMDRKIIPTSPFVWLSQLDISDDGKHGALIGQTTTNCDEIIRINVRDKVIENPKYISVMSESAIPEMITFTNREGVQGYAWFHPAYQQRQVNSTAPCIIKIHSGPTSLKHAGYSPETEFFRLHGYSVAHINYRGSVSFGYDYQYALAQKWGEAEVEDTLDLVKVLVEKELVDKGKLALMGSSAGGFSVLHLLIKYPGLFKAAICSYAVSDLVDDAENTHKFEKYYHRFLTGDYPDEKERFFERSPINHIGKIKDPVALYHGQDDPVVSVQQTEKMFNELQQNGVPSTLTIFEGEGHGFRRKENIETYYQSMITFLNAHL
jgi:dipeptidyl aminopeptidase/acylaminoacyl peptidase